MRKIIVIIGMTIGSYLGSCIPMFWSESLLSMSSLIFSALGALVGIYLSYKFSRGI